MKIGQFNFLQTVSGIYYTEDSATPFGLYFINESGIFSPYFPQSTSFTAPIHLFSDGDSFPTIVNIKQSGKVDGELKDIFPHNIYISGDSFSATPDYGILSLNISGNQTGNFPDITYFNIPWNGNLTGILLDINNIGIIFNGINSGCLLDNKIFNVYFTGQIENFETDNVNFNCIIRGNFKPKQKDSANISLKLYSIDFSPGLETIEKNVNDFMNMSFTINTISFHRAG